MERILYMGVRVTWRTRAVQRIAAAFNGYLGEVVEKAEKRDRKRLTEELTVGGRREKQLGSWVGQFETSREVLEAEPLMRYFGVEPGQEYPVRRPWGFPDEKKPLPRWAKKWLPVVAVYRSGKNTERERFGEINKVVRSVYSAKIIEDVIEKESPFLRYLKG